MGTVPENPADNPASSAQAADVPAGWVAPEVARAIFEETAAQNEAARILREEQQQEEAETVVPAVAVLRRDTFSTESVMTVTYTINRATDLSARISGMVLSQRIPPGWSVEDSNPPVTSFDDRTRVAKWLFVGQPVPEGQVTYRAVPVAEGALKDWSLSQSWYTYRDPTDGQSLSFNTEMH